MTEYELMLKRVVEDEVKPYIRALVDDAVKGLLRSLGDAGPTPANKTGETILNRLYNIQAYTHSMYDSLIHRVGYSTSTSAALTLTLSLHHRSTGRSHIEVGVKSSSTGDFYVEGSHDSVRWIPIATVTIAAGEENTWKRWPAGDHARRNAFPYVRVRTDLVADNEIVIVSSR